MEDRNSRSQELDSNELVQHLREKVRNQAQRLRALEQYRVLCEQRIGEFVPGHNFPVKPEDLGSGLPAQNSQELVMAKQKIARLEQQLMSQNIKVPLADNYTFPPPTTQLTLAQLQELYSAIYYQHHDMIKEKANLEESLRSEMLACEEQRAYIEVLKQALESNLQELGLTGRTIEDILSKSGAMENRDNTKTVKNNELLEAKSLECDVLLQERSKTDKHLKEAAEALQYAEEEVERLEEEKSALLDYIEQHTKKNEDASEEIEGFKKQILDLEKKMHNINKELGQEQSFRKELEGQLDSYKDETSRNEKNAEMTIEKLKGQIKGLEGKNESLQVNNTTLANTLQETQAELDELKSQHDISIKEVSSIRKNLSVFESKAEEAEKSSHKIIDANKDLEGKLVRAEKELKMFRERKVKELENEYKAVQEQIVMELDDAKNELEKAQALNKEVSRENQELKRKFKKITEELGKYQSSTSQTSQDFADMKKIYEAGQIQLRQLEFEKDKLNSDLQRLEFVVNTERSAGQLAQEENSALKDKLEEVTKLQKSLNESNRDKENKLQNALFEIENLKKNVSLAFKDIESERALKTQYYEDVLKLKKSQNTLSQAGSILEECKIIITEFSGNFGAISAASNNFSSILSSQYKDLLFKSNDKDSINLVEWVRISIEEMEALIRRLGEYKQDLSSVTQKLTMSQHKLDGLIIDESSLRDRERSLRGQLEAIMGEKEKLAGDRECLMGKVQNTGNEIALLKKELQSKEEECQRLRDQLSYTSSETIQWRNTAETDIFAIKAIEEKANLLLKEKKELEILMGKLQSSVPSSDLQRIFLEIMKCHSELEVINRERLRIENQLLRSEGEMRSLSRNHQQEKAIQVRKEVESLRTQLSNCDSQILTYKRRMITLEEEMHDVEKCERRRFALQFDTEKSYVHAQTELNFKTKELQNAQLSLFDMKRRQESVEKNVSFLTPQGVFQESIEDRPLLSYFDKLRRARNQLSDLKDQE